MTDAQRGRDDEQTALENLESALACLVERCNCDERMSCTDEVISAEAALELLYKARRKSQEKDQ